MRIRPLFLLLCAGAAFAATVRATSVVPPSFPELVAEADAIYRGRVTDVQARRVENAGASIIKTFVTIAIDRALKGPEQPSVTLEFLGGTIGDETLEVGGVPQFTVGERGIVFVQKNGRQFCPLVRLAHGSYRIEHDAAGREYMARANRAPLNDVAEVELSLQEERATLPGPTRASAARALSPDAFESTIISEARAPSAARPN